jgi:hypothetical protein
MPSGATHSSSLGLAWAGLQGDVELSRAVARRRPDRLALARLHAGGASLVTGSAQEGCAVPGAGICRSLPDPRGPRPVPSVLVDLPRQRLLNNELISREARRCAKVIVALVTVLRRAVSPRVRS